jgi:hypothetical protein
LVAIDYATKWVAKAFRNNIVVFIARFIYEYILIRFKCPPAIVMIIHCHHSMQEYISLMM